MTKTLDRDDERVMRIFFHGIELAEKLNKDPNKLYLEARRARPAVSEQIPDALLARFSKRRGARKFFARVLYGRSLNSLPIKDNEREKRTATKFGVTQRTVQRNFVDSTHWENTPLEGPLKRKKPKKGFSAIDPSTD